MSYQLTKILTGAYRFPLAADLQETNKNMRHGGNTQVLTITSNAATADASTGCSFTLAPAANVTLTVSNLVDGQSIFVVLAPSGGASVLTVASNGADAISSTADAKKALITIKKIGSVIYAFKTALVS